MSATAPAWRTAPAWPERRRSRRGAGSRGGMEPCDPDGSGLVLVAQAVEPLLHLFHLALDLVDIAASAGRRAGLRRFLALGRRRLPLTPCIGCEHREGALEHFHVPPHLFLERPERSSPERLRHLLAELFLLARERLDRHFEITGYQHLHRVAVEADELA